MPFLTAPRYLPPLDEHFRPAALYNRAFRRAVEKSAGGGLPLVLAVERADSTRTVYPTRVLPESHPEAAANLFFAERLVKFLLWQAGGCKVYVGGPEPIAAHIRQAYSAGGARAFDAYFMGNQVYRQTFSVTHCRAEEVPPAHELEQALGRHLEGNRIGFDLGASDLKVSAVVDGKAIYSEEIIWEPRKQTDPAYHYTHIRDAIRQAAAQLPHVDAVGGSSAGVIIHNQPMVASLFRGIPEDKFGDVRSIFTRIREEMGIPLEVVNDGEVTALAGSMSLEVNSVLGTALGSSQAAGYVTPQGNITNWLNELAFAPVDYSPEAPLDEWSGDRGVGSQFFSQQCVFRLAPKAGIAIPEGITDAEKLKVVQSKLESGDSGAEKIWQSMGYAMGYAIAHYADFYQLSHVLILGRCTSGRGGALILENAEAVLQGEFPDLAAKIQIHLPDEKIRRVGQSIAAASLPEIPKGE